MTKPHSKRFIRAVLLGTIMGISLFALSGWAPKHVRAQSQSDITLKATDGFDGYCKEGQWLPIHVEVQNSGADRKATVRVSYTNSDQGTTSASLDIELPSGARKKFFMYIMPQGFLRDFNVSLLDGKNILKKVDLKINCIGNENMLFGVISDTPASFTVLNDVKPLAGFVRAAQLTVSDLPDRFQALAALDALIISNADTASITPAQLQAIQVWIASGGRLFVTGGARWQGVSAGIDPLLPVEKLSTRNVSGLSSVAAYLNDQSPLETGSIVSVGTIRSGAHVLIEQDGLPILIQKQIGFGTVYYFAADPSLQPLNDWKPMQEFYARLLAFKPPVPHWAGRDGAVFDYNANQALGAIPELGIPSILYICSLLGVYVLVMGPLNYLFLRIIKRRELAWITIPMLAILFTCLSYGAGAIYRGRTPILNRLVIAQAWDGVDQASVHALVGVYSPIRSRYTIEAGDLFMPRTFNGNNGDIQSGNDWTVNQENTSMILPDVPIEIGALKAASFEGSLPALAIKHDLVLNIARTTPLINGTVQNNSAYILHDAMLVTPASWRKLGDVKPGESKQVTISLAPNPNGPDFYRLDPTSILNLQSPFPSKDANVARQTSLLQTAVYANYQTVEGNWGVYLMGWIDQPVLPITLRDHKFKTVDTMLYIQELNPALKTDGDTLNLPVSLFAWEASIGDVSPYRSWQLPAGGYILHFKPGIPIAFHSVEQLSLTLDSSSPNQVAVSIWNYINQTWDPIRIVGNVTPIAKPEQHVTPQGDVKIRIIGANGGWSDISASYVTLVVKP